MPARRLVQHADGDQVTGRAHCFHAGHRRLPNASYRDNPRPPQFWDVRRLRLDLEPWPDTQAAREVDEQLAAVGSAR
jgi:hypothetical protein